MNAEFNLSQIGQIAIPIKNVEHSLAFYRDTLGMQFIFQVPNMAFFNNGGVRLLLEVSQETESPSKRSSIIYYQVADIQSAHEILAARGVEFTDAPHLVAKMPDHDLWMAFFKDPDENILALMSEIHHA